MKLHIITEDKAFFNYIGLAGDMWRKKLSAAEDDIGLKGFSTENDDAVTERTVVIDQDHWDFTKCKFNCELHRACGDWQSPIMYFRCELVDGYARTPAGKEIYSHDPHFVFIPGIADGNVNLVKVKGGLAPRDDENDPDYRHLKKGEHPEPDEQKAWAALKAHLKGMVDAAIAATKSHELPDETGNEDDSHEVNGVAD